MKKPYYQSHVSSSSFLFHRHRSILNKRITLFFWFHLAGKPNAVTSRVRVLTLSELLQNFYCPKIKPYRGRGIQILVLHDRVTPPFFEKRSRKFNASVSEPAAQKNIQSRTSFFSLFSSASRLATVFFTLQIWLI